MTRSETELLIQLSRDTNQKLTELASRFNAHVVDDQRKFEALTEQVSKGFATQETRWRFAKWIMSTGVALAGVVSGWLTIK